MGARGPLPKPEGTRRRRNAMPGTDRITVYGKVHVPRPPATWDPIATRWYRSLKSSGQSQRYEPSDWAAALFCGELMSKLVRARKPSAQMAGEVWRMMTDLLTTEMARRRARIEIDRVLVRAVESEEPSSIDEYRQRLGGEEVDDDGAELEGER